MTQDLAKIAKGLTKAQRGGELIMQDEEAMRVWREANEAAMSEFASCEDTGCLTCRDAAAIIAQSKAKWQAEAFEMAAKVAEESADQCGDTIPGRARNATAVEIAEAIRALKDS